MPRLLEPCAPLTPAMFHVLLALAGDDLHGYAILKDIELRTNGEVKLSTGTLYGIIKRLLNDGLIAERRERPAAIHDDERRRYYRLTTKGREVAGAEAERLEKVVALARSRRLLKKIQTA
jgi:DNA-binding PadR family transcriptional regulator